MGCSSGIPHPSQTRRLSGLPFYSQSFSRFPQEALTTSFPVRSNQQAFHKVVTCCTASVSASDDAFTWDDVVKISKPVHISGTTRKRSKSAIALSLESHSEFLPFVIEVHSQRVSSNSVGIQIPVSCSDVAPNNFPKSLVLLRIYVVSRTCLLSPKKIQTLMAVAFIAEHRTRAVGDVIKSLGEEHSPASHFGYTNLYDEWQLPRHGGSVKGGLIMRVRNFSGSIESGRFINGHVRRKPANSFIVAYT
ncbi:unnamed protein product [Prunus armeniaca]